MVTKIEKLFSSSPGKEIFIRASKTLEAYNMKNMLCGGVLVGLSGGADSVMLLCFLYEYRRINGDFPLSAIHINHMIRGESADRDEEFSRLMCEELGIEFFSRKIDVPSLSNARKIGVEECARIVRYEEFTKIISGRNDLNSIAVAHNANDNLETILFNIFRGSGTRGASGIPPVRENIFRPLIEIDKKDIISALNSVGISFVTDETNADIDYKRNYIRNKIVPTLYELCDDPVLMASRFSSNLRMDDEYISLQADNIIGDADNISVKILRSLHPSIFARVIIKLGKSCGAQISSVSVNSISKLIDKDNFSVSLPGNVSFLCQYGVCSFKREGIEECDFSFDITDGKNEFSEFGALFLTEEKNVLADFEQYRLLSQVKLSTAEICGRLTIRSRKEGDTIFFGGMTRKIKTLFSDLKIPKDKRRYIPLLCDDKGIVWVPGIGVRDDGVKNGDAKYATLAIGVGCGLLDVRFYSASEFKKSLN